MTRLVLPSYHDLGDQLPLDLHSMVPRKTSVLNAQDAELTGISLILSRSYVLLVAEVLRALPRHLNDRNELATLTEGLNQILLAHGDDIGIVAHVLIGV